MRLIQGSIRTHVKGFLPIVWTDEALSAHGGLELFSRYMAERGWLARLREVFAARRCDTDYGSWRMSLAVIGMLIVGGSRLAHLRQLGRDPVFLRFARLRKLPSERTLSRWLGQMTEGLRDRLQALLRDVAFATWSAAEMARVTIDLDGTVIRTGVCVEGAERGFNPHHPKDPSYYPLTAHLAQTGQMLGVWNRAGNTHDSVGAVDRLRELIGDVRERLGSVPLEVRLDSAFCQKAVLDLLTASGVEYTIKMPMWKWLEVRKRITQRKRWTRVNASVDGFSLSLRIDKWKRTERVVVFRKRISGKPAKNFQLSLFQPDDGFYEYSMVTTNKTCNEATVWAFMAGRGSHENTLGELKNGLAFASVVTQDWDANSAWQIFNALTHNLVRDFQLHAGIATKKKNTRKRTPRLLFRKMRTLRFEWIHLPARIARPQGRAELRIAAEPSTRKRFNRALEQLAA
ncbi:MAG: IS1380 family transposase [bacterium]|nr:IS1380 family transposase [bacterium]